MTWVEKPTATEDVVTGIILLSEIRCQPLFDTRASHSFISRSFAIIYGMSIEETVHIR